LFLKQGGVQEIKNICFGKNCKGNSQSMQAQTIERILQVVQCLRKEIHLIHHVFDVKSSNNFDVKFVKRFPGNW